MYFGLDVGTTKICALIGAETEKGELRITGMGISPSEGLRKGVVIDIAKTVGSIKRAAEVAERISGMRPDSVYVGVAGDHISSINSSGVLKIRGAVKEITTADRDRAIHLSLKGKIPKEQRMIHVIPREYILDGVDGVSEPVGMSANMLEVKTHIVMGAVPSIQNLVKSVELAGLNVADIVLEPIASAEAVLTADERDLGTALLDIGGGTTDLAIFLESGICWSSVFPFGGNHVTRDIAVGLRVASREAELIKVRHGVALRKLADPMALVRARDLHDRKERGVLKVNLAGIVEARMSEMFELVRAEIERSGMSKLLAGGVVLTGGASQLDGVDALAADVLKLPVRVGTAQNIKGPSSVIKNGMYATGAGLLIYARKHPAGSHPKPLRSFNALTRKLAMWFTDVLPENVAKWRKSQP